MAMSESREALEKGKEKWNHRKLAETFITFIRISNLPSLSSSHGRGKNLGCGRRWSGKYPMNCHHFCWWLNLFRFQQSDGWDWRGKGCPPLFYCDSSHSHNRITHVALTSYLRQVRNRFESLKEIPEAITQSRNSAEPSTTSFQSMGRLVKAVFLSGESESGGLTFTLDCAEYGSKDDPGIYLWTAGLISKLSEPRLV